LAQNPVTRLLLTLYPNHEIDLADLLMDLVIIGLLTATSARTDAQTVVVECQ
jgi:uncharacterized protein YhfF